MAGKKPGEGSTLMDLVSWLLPRSELEMDGQKDQNSKSALFAPGLFGQILVCLCVQGNSY